MVTMQLSQDRFQCAFLYLRIYRAVHLATVMLSFRNLFLFLTTQEWTVLLLMWCPSVMLWIC